MASSGGIVIYRSRMRSRPVRQARQGRHSLGGAIDAPSSKSSRRSNGGLSCRNFRFPGFRSKVDSCSSLIDCAVRSQCQLLQLELQDLLHLPCTPCTAPRNRPVTANAPETITELKLSSGYQGQFVQLRPGGQSPESDGSEPEILAQINLAADTFIINNFFRLPGRQYATIVNDICPVTYTQSFPDIVIVSAPRYREP